MKRLNITSKTGHFNFCDSSQESVSCNISVFEGGNYLMGTNLTLEYEENPKLPTVDFAIELLEECFKKMWIDTSRGDKEKLLAYLKENQEEIDEGTVAYRIERLTNDKEKIEREIALLATPTSKEL